MSDIIEPETSKPKFKKNILIGIPIVASRETINLSKLEDFLDAEKLNNISDSWAKLDKTTKLKKLLVYANTYKEENELSDQEYELLVSYFKDCLDKKKLQKVKEVIYDKVTGLITSIPVLVHNRSTNNFTIKNLDKKASTIKSLAPKKVKGTIKHKHDSDDDDEPENN
jgi:hypothetical protein